MTAAPFQLGAVVKTAASVRPRRYADRVGSVAVVRRVTPLRRTVRNGERTILAKTKGGEVERTIAVYEEIDVPAVYESGLDFTDPDEPGTLTAQGWFRPSELSATGATSKRTKAERVSA